MKLKNLLLKQANIFLSIIVAAGLFGLGAGPAFAAPTISNPNLPEATVNQAYSYQLQATGGTAPYIFEKWYTTYPGADITLSSTGLLSGTPHTAGTWEYGIRVSSAAGLGSYAILNFKVNAGATGTGVVTVSNVQPASGNVAADTFFNLTWTVSNLTASAPIPTILSLQSVSGATRSETYRISDTATSINGNNTVSTKVPASVIGTNYKILVQINQIFPDGSGGGTFPKAESTGIVTITAAGSTSQSTLNLSVDSASTTGSVPAGAPNYNLGTFKFSATGGPVTITSFQVISDLANSNTNISNLKVYRDSNQLLATIPNLQNSEGSVRYATVTLASPITLSTGQSMFIDVTADVATFATGSVRVGIKNLTFSGTTPVVSGVLPLYGNTIQVTGATTSGNPVVTVKREPINPTIIQVSPGALDAVILSFKVSSAEANAYIHGFTLTGVYPPDLFAKLSNVRAQVGTVTVGFASSNATDYNFTFPSPILVAKDNSQIVKVLANVLSSAASSTVQPKLAAISVKDVAGASVNVGLADIISSVSISGTASSSLKVSSGDTLPDGIVGQSYSQTLQATGGSAPYSWTTLSNQDGLYPCCYTTLSTNGTFSSVSGSAGLMPYSGTYKLGVRVTDNTGASADKVIQYTIKSGSDVVPQMAEGFVDVASSTQVLGWAFNSTANNNRQTGTVRIVFEKVSNSSEAYTLSLTPSITRLDVNAHLQSNRGVASVNIPTGFSGDPRAVITADGVYRIKSATYENIPLVVSDVAKRAFAIGNATIPITTSKYVKVDGDATVYWVTSWGGKMPMLTEKIFLSYGAKFSDILTISQEELDMYDDVMYIKLQGNARVYKLEGTVKRYLTPAAATRLNVDPGKVVTTNSTEFYTYRTGSTVQ